MEKESIDKIPRFLMNGPVMAVSSHSSPREEFDLRKAIVGKLEEFRHEVKDLNLTDLMEDPERFDSFLREYGEKTLVLTELQLVGNHLITKRIRELVIGGKRLVLVTNGMNDGNDPYLASMRARMRIVIEV